jgi:hypothetical protein
MPTVFRIGPLRFFSYSADEGEPPHVHVERGKCKAKIWLDPVLLERSRGFRMHEINEIRGLVELHRKHFLEVWNEFFGG